MHAADPARPPARTVVVLGGLTMFGPLSLDLYLPALPQLADDLDASASAAQLSITACLVGLAAGQLLAGPLSDRIGRKRPLMVGRAGLHVGFRCLCSRALRDSPRGPSALPGTGRCGWNSDLPRRRARSLFRASTDDLLLPVAPDSRAGTGPGSHTWRSAQPDHELARHVRRAGWLRRGPVPGRVARPQGDTPPERRVVGGFRRTLHGYNMLLHDRFFVGCALSSGLAGATMFAYIAGSTFVLQRIYGMSPQGFSLVFGCISLGLVAAAQAGARIALVWPLTRVLGLGLLINLLGATALLVTVISGLPMAVLIAALVVMVCAVGLIFPTANALAMADYPDLAGTASSLQGLSQFVFGAMAAPLVGIAGEHTALPLGIVTTTVSLCAIASFTGLVMPVVRARMSR